MDRMDRNSQFILFENKKKTAMHSKNRHIHRRLMDNELNILLSILISTGCGHSSLKTVLDL